MRTPWSRSILPSMAMALVATASSASAQTTWYVDGSGNPPGDGSQSNPYTSIQYAIDQPTTMDGDTLLVLPGTYVESFSPSVAIDFQGKDLVLLSQAGPTTTILDAAGKANCIMFDSSETAAATVDGFTIRNASNPGNTGGAIVCIDTHPTITGNVITANYAFNGAGVALLRSDSLITDNEIVGNSGINGVGMIVTDGAPHIHGNLFQFNSGDVIGGSGGGSFAIGTNSTGLV